MGSHPRDRSSQHARPRAGSDAQSLVDLPGTCVPGMGPDRSSTSLAGPSASATSCRTRWRLVYGAVEEARGQILRAAARQFEEGTCSTGGTRRPVAVSAPGSPTISDFLPLVTCHYVATTGDAALLDERVPFLRAPVLRPEQEEDYGLPDVSDVTGTVYEHCVRALDHGLRLGPHGLPLMGTGDWNDGMNQVGAGGQGESVWNGWFMLGDSAEFAGLAEQRG